MINAIANYSLREIERVSHDEYERETFYKTCTIAAPLIQFLELVVAAILAWVLPGKMSLLCLLALVPSVIGNIISTVWLRRRVAIPFVGRNWLAMVLYLIPLAVMFTGIAFNAYAPEPAAYLIGAGAGVITVVILTPFIRRRQHRRDQARLDAELED
ncbi:transcriptional regulator [Corynebacterium sp. MSK218]|uniref:transcriptional regulator n=1 Tax=Corynebacterium sp. MSK218 TaxID=3050218 RepID=UPI00254E1D9E|nr:transcriptional regulator [Corynebacterium sp. MSK218]MDK8763946.1 transcriptional regulator [Corynebacterium sp. MSK218]